MKRRIIDGNAAVSHVSYAFSEVVAIYPITPSSPMAELADEWAANGKTNLFGSIPKVIQLQSEGGAAGTLHGALTCGALATTYTCSQGLLLMLPNMYKIAGELLPTVFHVSARALATHALSIFGDHQDVMACRQTGFSMLASSSVQECMDMALIAHLATLKTEIPFLHFLDGFRTSHETTDIDVIEYEEIRALLDMQDVERFRKRALTSFAPTQRGTAQNPDVYFQNRESANRYYAAVPTVVQRVMEQVAQITGRLYHVFDYYGADDAKYVAVVMGSGASVMQETVDKMLLNAERVGVIIVRLYRPFDAAAFCSALPATCQKITVLDRTKEAGSLGEPLYLDVCAALKEQGLDHIQTVGGRYGLGLKELTPTMCYAVFKNLQNSQPKNHFTVGICDDITHTSLDCSTPFFTAENECVSCKFYGLGSDGTVGANKNTVKIIGEHTSLHVQAYFVYDSRKSGGVTISHLRFGNTPIRASYLIDRADFIACHNPSYLTRYDMLSELKEGGVFLLNCPWNSIASLEENLPIAYKRMIAEKKLRFYVIDATKIADCVGLSGRTSTIMQAAFFLLNPSIMPYNEAVSRIEAELKRKFTRKGEETVRKNLAALYETQAAIRQIEYPMSWMNAKFGATAPKQSGNRYFQEVMHPILTLKGDTLPTSAFSPDGTVPTDTAKYEQNGIAAQLPKWISENCIQCNQCAFVCPHATIRPFLLRDDMQKPDAFITKKAVGMDKTQYRIQVAATHCKGCGVCAEICPAKEKALVMTPAPNLLPDEERNWDFAQSLPTLDLSAFKKNTVKGSQFQQPLFEFSYACAGCGETPYIKVLTQLFGEKMIIANATGCSSIYGGSSPTCPYAIAKNGRGPAWANSLFEDNAEFGLGMRLAWNCRGEAKEQSVWIIGGDGWAYDIGYGGLDHVLASGANVNVLVLDSEVYSNTGGQASKATPLGAVARFASGGKRKKKKNLGLMAMTYGHVYVAQVSMGANMQQLVTALTEAERYDGPSLVIAYSPCIAHGVHLSKCMEREKLAVESGYWHLYRYNPSLKEDGKPPFILDSKPPKANIRLFLETENRFATLKKSKPEVAEALFAQAEKDSAALYTFYQTLSEMQ